MKNVCLPCDELLLHLSDPLMPLAYICRFDEYVIERREGLSVQVMKYCPFCGGALPISRRDQFFDILDEAGIDYHLGGDEAQLPDRLKQDRWWSK